MSVDHSARPGGIIGISFRFSLAGWSGGAKVLGNLPVPGRPTNLDYSRARACCACSRCGWGVVWTFFSLIYPFSSLSPSLWETARYRLKYCLKGPLNPEQPTNQSIFFSMEVCCVFPLESPHRGDSKEYTQYTNFNIKKKITLNFPKSAAI